ncbi:hypothetical protein N0V95_010186 [Ascochyta clinopodiicola]|nr:hypothetical protein N0V95_010186 [Ascochyta clinopodiicola]
MDTQPAPSVPVTIPTAPAASSGVLAPSGGNATVPSPSAPAEFTGAASANKAGVAAMVVVGGAVLFGF